MLLIAYKKCKKLFKENNPIKVSKIEFQLLRDNNNLLKLNFSILNGNSVILTGSLLKETG